MKRCKHMLLVLIAMGFIASSICVASTCAFAQEDTDNYEVLQPFDINSLKDEASSDAVESFNNYINSLDARRAQLILEDKQMVAMMLMDEYWNPPVTSNAVQPRAAFTTVPNYGNGKFYNYLGVACNCHSKCDSSALNQTRCTISEVATGNCKRYAGTGAIQCKGFADMAFKYYKGSDVSSSNTVSLIPGFTNDSAGQAAIKNFFASRLTPGSNVRVESASGARHSFIYGGLSTDGYSFLIYDCNGTASACKIRSTTMSFSDFTKKYTDIISAWKV